MSNCSASCTSVRSPLIAAIATFALKADVWFRRGLLLMLSPDSRAKSCPLSGRSSTYRPVQILEAGSKTPLRALILPVHLTAVTMWIEALRLLPHVPREARIPFANGVGLGFMSAAQVGTLVGYYLATSLPPLLTAGLLFLTPISFLISTTRNCRLMSDWLALVLGLVLGPLMAAWQMGLDLLWTGIVAGSLAYGIHRLREALK